MSHISPPTETPNVIIENPKTRGVVYQVAAWLGLVLGGTQVGFAAAGAGQPVWLTVAFAVYGFVAAGIGFTAYANRPQ